MIKSWSYDVEIFPNLFSITFVNISQYLDKFKDCVDSKGSPIPMTDMLSVAEIEKRLSEVETHIFWIDAEDDHIVYKTDKF